MIPANGVRYVSVLEACDTVKSVIDCSRVYVSYPTPFLVSCHYKYNNDTAVLNSTMERWRQFLLHPYRTATKKP